MTGNLQLAFKFFMRELKQGELTLLFLSLLIATGSLSSIGFLIQHIEHSMNSHANQLNGAQLVLKSSRSVPSSWLDKADELKLEQAQMQVFPSMLVHNGEFKLAQIKAVSDNFPLQGELRVSRLSQEKTSQVPPAGEIWLDKRLDLFFNLQLEKNAFDSKQNGLIELGEAEFRASGLLERVPGQSSSLVNIAPSAMIKLSDLAATATVQPGSRVDYLYFFSSSTEASALSLDTYQQWLQARLQAGQSLRSGVDDLKAVNASLQKAGDFLSLAAILTVLLSAIAIAINSHRYGQKQYKNNAIMLCLGCTESRIIFIELLKLLSLALIASLAGILLGYITFLGLFSLLDVLLPVESLTIDAYEPQGGLLLTPVWVSLSTGLFLLLSISMANLIRLKKVSPMGLIRQDFYENSSVAKLNLHSQFFYGLSFIGLVFISLWYTGNIKITLYFYLILALSVGLLYIIARLLLQGLISIGCSYQLLNRLSLISLERHKTSVLLQITTFSLIFALLIIIFLVRSELLQNWQQQFPEQTPNHFIINVQTYERAKFTAFLQQHEIQTQGLYPMVRGRLRSLNSQPINAAVPESARTHNALHRELNLSFSQTLAPAQDAAAISIESTLAKALHIKIGDRLGFQVGSRKIAGQVTKIRTVKWDSFQPNFYIIFSPGLIEQYPMTWIASFYLAAKDKVKLNKLMQAFPGVTIIEVDEILKEIQLIIERVSDAIEMIFLFIVLAGALILTSSLSATMASRMYENAVIRTLGASARQIRHYLRVEFMVVALLSAFIALLLAEFSAYILYRQIFQMVFTLHPWVWLAMTLLSSILIVGLGMLVVKKIFTRPANVLLNDYIE